MNNNPFEPVSPEPATLEQTDKSPDVFADDGNSTKPARPAVMLDGISPTPIQDSIDSGTEQNSQTPSVMNNLDMPVSATDPIDFSAAPTDASSDIASTETNLDATMGADPMKNIETTDSGSQQESLEDTDIIGKLSARKNGNSDTLLEESEIDSDPKKPGAALAPKKVSDKPPRQFTISIASIILFVLAIAGIGGSIYFYMQNNSNYNKMKTYQAQVEELQNDSTNSSNSDSKSSSQFDALQTKISDLTKQVEDKQKTIDEDKTKIDDLTKKNDELTKANSDLTAKVQNISDLTTRIDTLLNKLNATSTTTQ